MTLLVLLKFLHVLPVIVAVGANFTYAFWLRSAGRQLTEAERDPSSDAYAAAATRSMQFGVLATGITVLIVFLMVAKPF